ncbi:outer membrane protein assembly factor BamA [Pinisolibacter sp.]|uniref:outer membrane protein assembly factor BamA n=1 Tax=Pinisolibacter sp. TaxID=2172024 RepID=UPI002FDEA82E
MSSFTKVMTKTALAAAMLTVVPAIGIESDLLGASVARADVVSHIVVRGITRVEAETVRSYVAVKPGKSFSAQDIDASLKALYATDLFSDVKISREGGSLVVTVVESPMINKIAFEGNKRITDEQLKGVIQTQSRGFMSKARVQGDVQRLLEAYRRNGRYRAQVEAKVISLADNRVNLVYEIDEGDKTAVTRIGFVGNHAMSSGRLRDVVKTRESGMLGWLRTTDTYDPERLQSDQELLRRYYMKNGYADMRVVSATADLDRERNVFFVSFTVDEGEQYTFGAIDVQSSLANLDMGSLKSAVGTREGSVYSAEDVEKTMEALTLAAARSGYPFAQVRPRAQRDYANHTIGITYYVEEGQRVYVERINVRGNDRTRDYVIRREFDMSEGDAYSKVLVNKAERRLNRLGFFKSVRTDTVPGSAPDRVVVNVDVEEQATGEIGFGAGYSTADGVLGDVSFSEKNFLGRGQYFKASAQYGQYQRGYQFSFTEPYFLGYRISAGFDVYQKQYLESSYRNYSEKNTGGTIRFGLPITENLTFGVSYTINQQEIGIAASQHDGDFLNGEASLAYLRFVCPTYPGIACADYSRRRLTSIPGYSLVYNTLDNMQLPHDGIYAKFSQEFAGAGGDARFLRTTVDARIYKELYADWGVIGMARVRAGNITGLGQKVELFDNFFIGGETIRGFAPLGIGPRDISQITQGTTTYTLNSALGGRNYVAGTVEVSMPFPGTPEEFGLYLSGFSDAGLLWGVDKQSIPAIGTNIPCTTNPVSCGTFNYVDKVKVRASVGVGLMWKSPFGPLRGDFGIPVVKDKYDQTQIFRFSGGTQF